MTTLRFTKMHGCGNDFVVIDASHQPFEPSAGLLQRLSDRRTGVGCDQVLVVQPPTTAGIDFDYRIYNADGSESGQCGNGARALALFIRAQGLSAKTSLRVQTRTAVMQLELLACGQVRVDMGQPRWAPAELPLLLPAADQYRLQLDGFGTVQFGAVSMGNPHAVIVVDAVDRAPAAALGRALQARREFPESVNVGFLQVLNRGHARLRVYERGVGETLACGSGACAAHVVGRRLGLLDETSTVDLPGGALTLRWRGEGDVVEMTGPAVTVFTGEIML